MIRRLFGMREPWDIPATSALVEVPLSSLNRRAKKRELERRKAETTAALRAFNARAR